jgi:hypothetical protein
VAASTPLHLLLYKRTDGLRGPALHDVTKNLDDDSMAGSDYSRVEQDEKLSQLKVGVKLSRVNEGQSQRRCSR